MSKPRIGASWGDRANNKDNVPTTCMKREPSYVKDHDARYSQRKRIKWTRRRKNKINGQCI